MQHYVVWRIIRYRLYWLTSAEWEKVSEHDAPFEALAACYQQPNAKHFVYVIRKDIDPPPPPLPMLLEDWGGEEDEPEEDDEGWSQLPPAPACLADRR